MTHTFNTPNPVHLKLAIDVDTEVLITADNVTETKVQMKRGSSAKLNVNQNGDDITIIYDETSRPYFGDIILVTVPRGSTVQSLGTIGSILSRGFISEINLDILKGVANIDGAAKVTVKMVNGTINIGNVANVVADCVNGDIFVRAVTHSVTATARGGRIEVDDATCPADAIVAHTPSGVCTVNGKTVGARAPAIYFGGYAAGSTNGNCYSSNVSLSGNEGILA